MTTPTDVYLARARQLDEAALTAIYLALNRRLFAYAYRLTGDNTEAEDLVAETFQRLLVALQNGGGPREHLAAYLYRAVHNLVTDRFRRRSPSCLPFDDALSEAAEGDPAQVVAQDLDQARARAALWALTPDQRLVLTLKYFEAMSNEEVAAALGKPVGAVKALQHRALATLRRRLTAAASAGEVSG
jgi:RNA polymerase sigma-70 factor (ECF subfamily)